MEISVESLSGKFTDHLDMRSNFRIIFSGKFGMGKTFFLNKYFDERSERFNKILISPVNYVVSSNEDIFELIKADILKELFLTGKVNLKKLPKDTLLQKISNYVEDYQTQIRLFSERVCLGQARRLNTYEHGLERL